MYIYNMLSDFPSLNRQTREAVRAIHMNTRSDKSRLNTRAIEIKPAYYSCAHTYMGAG